jgi:hypothetical protein
MTRLHLRCALVTGSAWLIAAAAVTTSGEVTPQQTAPPATAGAATASDPKNWTAAEDHQNMLDQLGIKSLRPGPSGNEQQSNHANFDEATANPFPNLPEVLTLKNGRKVTNAKLWSQRRQEIVEDFEREVYGRIPSNAPRVNWKVTETANGVIGHNSCGWETARRARG